MPGVEPQPHERREEVGGSYLHRAERRAPEQQQRTQPHPPPEFHPPLFSRRPGLDLWLFGFLKKKKRPLRREDKGQGGCWQGVVVSPGCCSGSFPGSSSRSSMRAPRPRHAGPCFRAGSTRLTQRPSSSRRTSRSTGGHGRTRPASTAGPRYVGLVPRLRSERNLCCARRLRLGAFCRCVVPSGVFSEPCA